MDYFYVVYNEFGLVIYFSVELSGQYSILSTFIMLKGGFGGIDCRGSVRAVAAFYCKGYKFVFEW